MKISSGNKGFSLVELLTVIAIIAILAAIIFPVMGVVKERAKENNCMANLHQIAQGVAMFKTDNRRYPEALVEAVYNSNGDLVDFGAAKSDAHLFSEYVPSVKAFHCPSSNIVDTKAVSDVPLKYYDPSGETIKVYNYNSYEVYINNSGTVERHYCINWANSDSTMDSSLSPNEGDDTEALWQADYERQLKFRNPPADTVVTWCSYHQNGSGTSAKGNAIVVFLDGSAEKVPAGKMNACKWRVKPSKG